MPNVDIPQGIDIGGSPRRQETMGGTFAQTRSERVLEQPNEPPLIEGGYTPGSDEGRITLAELIETYTTLSNRVTKLENEISTTKVVYHKAFITLTNRVKKLESQLKQKISSAVIHSSDEEGRSVHIEDSPKHRRIIKEIDKDKNINLRSSAKDKGKGITQETELPKKLKKKEMIWLSLDEELAQSWYKKSYFKGMKYEDIRPLFKRIWDQVHIFVPKDSKIEREVMKRAGFSLQQRSSKKQRLDQQTEKTEEEAKAQGNSDQEVEDLNLYMRIIYKKDITIKAIPLAIKPLVNIEYKIVKEGKISTYHITRADGSARRYTSMINLLENIDREDFETL
nr:hypothetical protein [Tanacetum cinerariifolium]